VVSSELLKQRATVAS